MDDFVGRTAELAALGKQYAGAEGALVPIYGRRRVGKSELIRQTVLAQVEHFTLGDLAAQLPSASSLWATREPQ